MSIQKAFEAAFRRKQEKAWDKIYVVVDIHDTILQACYEKEETYSMSVSTTSSVSIRRPTGWKS